MRGAPRRRTPPPTKRQLKPPDRRRGVSLAPIDRWAAQQAGRPSCKCVRARRRGAKRQGAPRPRLAEPSVALEQALQRLPRLAARAGAAPGGARLVVQAVQVLLQLDQRLRAGRARQRAALARRARKAHGLPRHTLRAGPGSRLRARPAPPRHALPLARKPPVRTRGNRLRRPRRPGRAAPGAPARMPGPAPAGERGKAPPSGALPPRARGQHQALPRRGRIGA